MVMPIAARAAAEELVPRAGSTQRPPTNEAGALSELPRHDDRSIYHQTFAVKPGRGVTVLNTVECLVQNRACGHVHVKESG